MGVVDLVVLDRILRATSKKRVVNFFEEKSAPPDKILATHMDTAGNLTSYLSTAIVTLT